MTPAYDVIVLGLGGMGSAAAYHLAALGKRVLGLEQFTPAHDRGSSHGGTRIIREAYFEDPAYVPLVQHAYTRWQALEQATGQDLLRLTGGLMISRPDSGLLAGALASARLHDLPHTILSAADIRRRYPIFQPEPDEIGVYEPRAGLLRPEACVRAHLELAARHGAELHFEEPAIRWTAENDSIVVETARGRFSAERLVITAGPWAAGVIRELAPHLRVERVPVFWFQPGSAAAFDPAICPVYIWHRAELGFFYGFPQIEGQVKVARHYAGQNATPETLDRTVHTAEIDEMRAILARFIPDIAGNVTNTSVCMYTNSPDLNFIVDRHPQHANVVVAAGFSGHGFKFCPVIGELLAALATDPAAMPIELFRWSRLAAQPASPG